MIAASLFFCASIVPAQGEEEVISIDSSVVVMNAVITDSKGKPAFGLSKEQFQVLEDGQAREITLFGKEETPFAAVILIDTSGSMENRVSLARAAAISFLDELRAEDQAAIYNFDSKVCIVQDFSGSRDIAYSAFGLKAEGMTVLNDAIFDAAKSLSQRKEKRRAIIVISDGADTKSSKSDEKALKEALAANALIYTVDMSAPEDRHKPGRQNIGALKNFAEKSGGKFIPTPGGSAMREAFKNIADELGKQYTIGFSPGAEADGKWHHLELRVKKPGLTIRTRKGYHSARGKEK